MAEFSNGQGRVTGAVRQAWDGGGIVDMTLEARTPINGWRLDVDVGGEIVNIWNARILGRDGDRYTLGPLDYNVQIPNGGVVELGVQVEGVATFDPLGFSAQLASDVAAETAAAPTPAPPPPEPSPGTPTPDDAAARRPVPGEGEALGAGALQLATQSFQFKETPDRFGGLFVEGETVAEPAASSLRSPGHSFAEGPLFARGAEIVDSGGMRADIHGINWFGFETDIFVAHGLWARNWREIMDEIRSLGFNTLRVPFSGELVSSGGGKPSGIDFALNPDLEGLNGLQILDAVVAYADKIGLRILLDYHRGTPGGGPNENGLWFGEGRTEADVIAEWQTMATRYANAPAVIGADLINEPHMATWGDGSATDWAAGAERIGNAVLAIAPDWLIVVEGISTYEGNVYWWGGNLQGARDRPVVLDVPGKLVYSPHDYPASVHPQDWFFDGTDLREKFRENWGYLVEEGIAPVLIGEWGSRLDTPVDLKWAQDLAGYLADFNIPWLWWSLNPNSGDTGGIFEDDWSTIRTDVTTLLDPFLDETRPEVSMADSALFGPSAAFTITLARSPDENLVVKYATSDGTAEAGEDYVATAGTLLFAPGETEKTVNVPVLSDREAEGDEFFYLVLGGAGNIGASGTAIIKGDGGGARAEPFVDVAGTVLNDDGGAARFRVMLSEPAPSDVTVNFSAAREGASPSAAAMGSLVIPAGGHEATIEVSVDEDATRDGSARFVVELTGAAGAQIRTASALGVVAAEPPAAAEIAVAGSAPGDARLTIDLVLENDWGSGALFNVVIRNVSSDPVSAWQMAIDLPFDLSELWSAVLVSDEGSRITVRNAAWNGEIAPGATVDFGFIADEGGLALNQILNQADVELAVQ